MNSAKAGSRLWSIVLAGGEESRLGSLIRCWLGTPKPKQYCTFVGTRSLFQHALDRAAKLSEWEHIVAVISRKYERDARSQLKGRAGCMILAQPAHANTVAAIYLSLTHIRARDPQATVVVYPSDHFVYPESRFLQAVHRAVWTVQWLPDRLVLLGIPPDHLELDYGWILPGERLDASNNYQVSTVRSFLEHPTVAQADSALGSGALWNTNVLAAKAKVLWELGWQCCPTMMVWFERLAEKIEISKEANTLETIYQDTMAYDFSSDILQLVPDRTAVVEMTGVLWSDWNKPERIAHMLRRIGRQPAFPLTCLNPPFAPLPIPVGDESVLTIP
jgi:mannose-1-phosphate guanylyltransferase